MSKEKKEINPQIEFNKKFEEFFYQSVLKLKERQLGIDILNKPRKVIERIKKEGIIPNYYRLLYMDLAEARGLNESDYKKLVVSRKGAPLTKKEIKEIEDHRSSNNLRKSDGLLARTNLEIPKVNGEDLYNPGSFDFEDVQRSRDRVILKIVKKEI